MDWSKIKIEYITTDTSYRKLAKKYGISTNSIFTHAKNEKWLEEKKRYEDKTYTQTVEKISEGQAKRTEKLLRLTDKVLDKLERSIDATEECNYDALRKLTSSLKDIKDIEMIKKEQDDEHKEITVKLEGEAEKYSE